MVEAQRSGQRRYVSHDEDSARWDGFEFRDGDIVISTRSKHGTTWMQRICSLLVLQTRELPAPLSDLSPWLDWLVEPIESVHARLDAQQHRRFIKTHTPLDGLPIDQRATYVVVAREPLDAAVSLYHHSLNLDRVKLHELAGSPLVPTVARPIEQWIPRWLNAAGDWEGSLDSLSGVLHHVNDAWSLRERLPNVVLVHYADLSADLEGEMRRLANRLGIEVDAEGWPDLVDAATLASMRTQASVVVPDRRGVIRDADRFFRRGGAGAGREVVDDELYDAYVGRMREGLPSDLFDWLHREDR